MFVPDIEVKDSLYIVGFSFIRYTNIDNSTTSLINAYIKI